MSIPKHRRRDLLETILDLARRVADGYEDARTTCREYSSDGYPTVSAGGGSRSTSVADPVATAVVRSAPREGGGRWRPNDRFRADLERADELLARVAGELEDLERFVIRHSTTVETDTEPVCASCRRLNVDRAAYRLHPDLGDKVPNLPLCRWCYDFTRTFGGWPARALVRAHEAGKRITVPMVETHHGREAVRLQAPG